ncbi:MAG: SDR family oxidoreductase [Candidatus Nanopelagicales bacterium]|nr:SDR family oxidoreductase [Candidatus Nanopelagicales bacterium]
MTLCLVTGATGYVGGRLIPELLAAGFTVRVLARSPEKLRDIPWSSQVEIVVGDASDAMAVGRALAGVDVAYYLLHSLQQGPDLEAAEIAMARTFAAGAAEQSVGRIIYLGGLAPELDESAMSPHMRSRVQVGQALRASGVPTIELRAAVVIGSGSASFEMLRYLTERLPAMITPRWVRTKTQPIAIRDVLGYLVASASLPPEVSRAFDIGGPDVLSYQDMMQDYAAVAGLRRRLILPINLLSPQLSSHWVSLVTPVPRSIARPLVRSLRHPAICSNDDIKAYVPDPPGGLLTYREAVARALARVQDAQVATRWSGATLAHAPSEPLPSDPDWAGGTLYTDVRTLDCTATPEELWRAIERIGGDNGWYAGNWLWQLRGVQDTLFGGVGLRRGRRDPNTVMVGEPLDFWRVEERIRPQLLRLRAEMRLPGRAWLEFRVEPGADGGSVLHQRAVFLPRGLAGHVYWWAVAPFHAFIFPPMARRIVAWAEALTSHRAH